MKKHSGLSEYNKINTHANIMDADAHKLIQMLMVGAIDKINQAKACVARNDIDGKCTNISLAITIVDGLQASLDLEQGGEIGENLFKLYTYMMEQLLKANLATDVHILDEVLQLIVTLKEGWDGIQGEAKQILQGQPEKLNDGTS